MGLKLEYFETRFEKNIFYLQPWAAVKNIFVSVSGAQPWLYVLARFERQIQFSTLGSSKNCNC